MSEQPLILSIETATLGGSVCVSQGNRVLAASSGDPAHSRSNTLLIDIDDCLRRASVSVHEVQLFAAASGPGSFTGLRIGLATVKALASTVRRPCVGVPTLAAIAHAGGSSERMVALLPAGRGEVFVQMFSVSGNDVVELDEAAHLLPARALSRYESAQSIKWTGPGALLYQTLIEQRAGEKDWSVVSSGSEDLAKDVAAIAWQRFRDGLFEEAETLTAIYVRPSDAELKMQVRLENLDSLAGQVSIVSMSEHDLLEVVEIEEQCRLSRWGWAAYYAELQGINRSLMMVARPPEQGTGSSIQQIVGYIVARLSAGELHINNVAVRNEFRGRGIGSALLNRILAEGRKLEATVAFLEMREGNAAARALYEKTGFRTTGRRRNYYTDPVEDALTMSADLKASA